MAGVVPSHVISTFTITTKDYCISKDDWFTPPNSPADAEYLISNDQTIVTLDQIESSAPVHYNCAFFYKLVPTVPDCLLENTEYNP